jgi:hypothetical protein
MKGTMLVPSRRFFAFAASSGKRLGTFPVDLAKRKKTPQMNIPADPNLYRNIGLQAWREPSKNLGVCTVGGGAWVERIALWRYAGSRSAHGRSPTAESATV